jgi:hypothetical protein
MNFQFTMKIFKGICVLANALKLLSNLYLMLTNLLFAVNSLDTEINRMQSNGLGEGLMVPQSRLKNKA